MRATLFGAGRTREKADPSTCYTFPLPTSPSPPSEHDARLLTSPGSGATMSQARPNGSQPYLYVVPITNSMAPQVRCENVPVLEDHTDSAQTRDDNTHEAPPSGVKLRLELRSQPPTGTKEEKLSPVSTRSSWVRMSLSGIALAANSALFGLGARSMAPQDTNLTSIGSGRTPSRSCVSLSRPGCTVP